MRSGICLTNVMGMPPAARPTPLPRKFYQRDPRIVGPDLLNKILAMPDGRSGRIVEVEAYCGAEDPAAHSFRGRTARNASMFGEQGHLYVYFTYGMHYCANAVCWERTPGSGVLLRALQPLGGIERMREGRHGIARDSLLCSGPARLTEAMGIDRELDGADLVLGSGGPLILDDGTLPPALPTASTRIGISRGIDHPWRWHVDGNVHVSKRPSRARAK